MIARTPTPTLAAPNSTPALNAHRPCRRAEDESISFELMHKEAEENARIEREVRQKGEREAMAKADEESNAMREKAKADEEQVAAARRAYEERKRARAHTGSTDSTGSSGLASPHGSVRQRRGSKEAGTGLKAAAATAHDFLKAQREREAARKEAARQAEAAAKQKLQGETESRTGTEGAHGQLRRPAYDCEP